jgi:biotin carboxylase
MSRQLIVVGGGVMQLPVLRLARSLGVSTLCLDGSAQAPGRREADHFVVADIKDKEACLLAAQAHAETSGVDGVLTVGTDFSTTVAWIAQHLGLPGHRWEAALNAKDKSLMRARFSQAGLASPKFQVLRQGQPAPCELPLPCVIKPTDSMGARGVQLVRSEKEWPQAVAQALSFSVSGGALAEEFIEGPEFSLDALIQKGRFFRMGLADRDIHFPPHFVELGHSFPSLTTPVQAEGLWRLLEAAAHALGLHEGAVKGDLKWSKGGPVLVEVAARLSGGFMSGWTYPLHSGRTAIEGAIKIALGEPFDPPLESLSRGVVERAFVSIPGRLKAVRHIEKLPSLEGFKEIFWNVQPGGSLVWPKNNVQKAGNVIVAAESLPQAQQIARSAQLLVELELQAPNTATEAFLSDLETPWWFPQAQTQESLPCQGWETWNDAYGLCALDWKERLDEGGLWPSAPDAEFWRVFFKAGPQGVRYTHTLRQEKA